uniref:Uncharacterized protein n=1 Tax=Heterorhabditis bacteriophora TaxID=37862 RepID=A0A1I7WGI3_HETBA
MKCKKMKRVPLGHVRPINYACFIRTSGIISPPVEEIVKF